MLVSTALLVATPAGCSIGSDRRATPPTATPLEASTTTSSSASSTTTSVSTTTTAARPTTTSPASSPEGHAQALYAAWTSGDRTAAEKVAQPQAVADLFARPWQAADGWAFAECSGAAGSVICTWRRPSGQQLMLRVRNMTPVTVSEVRFQP